MKNSINSISIRHLFFSVWLLTLIGCGQQSDSSPKVPRTQAKKTVIDTPTFLNCALDGKIEAIREALEAGVDADILDDQHRTALLLASFNGHTSVAKLLLERGALLNHRDLAGRTALMYAASGSNLGTVELLVKAGAEVNAVDSDEGFTALMHAAAEGQTKVVEMLLEHNADSTLRDKDGDTARDFAVKNGHTEVARLLTK